MTYIIHYLLGGIADRVRGVDKGVPGTGANTPLADHIGNIIARGGAITRVERVSAVSVAPALAPMSALAPVPALAEVLV